MMIIMCLAGLLLLYIGNYLREEHGILFAIGNYIMECILIRIIESKFYNR
jgi:hypothetical protein